MSFVGKDRKIKEFKPSAVGIRTNNIYGLPFTVEESSVVVLPVPWEVTVSHSGGTSRGPQAVFDASRQVDLYGPQIKDLWKIGIAMEDIPTEWLLKNDKLRQQAQSYISALESGTPPRSTPSAEASVLEIDSASKELNLWVKAKTLSYLRQKKIVALLGGDHSTPLGLIHALGEMHRSFGILQIDAHADLRNAYEGFEFSHASIMFNALKMPQLAKLVQVGVRDCCDEEVDLIRSFEGRIIAFWDRDIKRRLYKGQPWDRICAEIVKELPDHVYVSFDIDGLDPKLCPNTGTPVAGGFEAEEVLYLLERIVEAGKQILAFDLTEVVPGNSGWDANVAARLLYRIIGLTAKSQNIS